MEICDCDLVIERAFGMFIEAFAAELSCAFVR